MREKLKELDIRLTELSDYLQISRPTLYKFIQMYEDKKYKAMDKEVRKLFDYIERTPDIGKRNVMNYIINSMHDGEESFIKIVTESIAKNGIDEEKERFILNIIETQLMDDIIPYLNRCFDIMRANEGSSKGMDEFLEFREKITIKCKKREKDE